MLSVPVPADPPRITEATVSPASACRPRPRGVRHSLLSLAGTVLRCGLVAVTLLLGASWPARAFDFDDVAKMAADLSASAYSPAADSLPPALQALSYDQYRDIRFRPDKALWHSAGLPFELMFFHRGKMAVDPVRINEVSPQGVVQPIGFDPADFDYGRNKLQTANWKNLGFAGFRVHYALNSPAYKDEAAVFLGASYFRMLGAGQRYGLSARGLALDTVGGRGEEFPRFVEFWIERPAPGARELVIYALLDSRRATGAYRIALRPGSRTVAAIRTRVFLRAGAEPVATLGLAPLTSMFDHGENQPRPGDFRPEVHDSDGLMIASGAASGDATEWLWRPLINPKGVLVTSFATQKLRGFGLMQRDRSFADYQDLEARYEQRPSAWITPQGDWGAGRVELMQLPTPDETQDNIVAYWVPATTPAPGVPIDFAYDISWEGDDPHRPPTGWATQSRRGEGLRGHGFTALGSDEVQYVVDFTGPALAALPADAVVRAVASVSPNARIVESNAYRNDATQSWRMTLRVKRIVAGEPVELRAFLQRHSDALTETWTSIFQPD